jgi:hypothetical protein
MFGNREADRDRFLRLAGNEDRREREREREREGGGGQQYAQESIDGTSNPLDRETISPTHDVSNVQKSTRRESVRHTASWFAPFPVSRWIVMSRSPPASSIVDAFAPPWNG